MNISPGYQPPPPRPPEDPSQAVTPTYNINPVNTQPIKRNPSVLSPELVNRFQSFQTLQNMVPNYQTGFGGALPALLRWAMMRSGGVVTPGQSAAPAGSPIITDRNPGFSFLSGSPNLFGTPAPVTIPNVNWGSLIAPTVGSTGLTLNQLMDQKFGRGTLLGDI